MNYLQYLTDHVEETTVQYKEKFYVSGTKGNKHKTVIGNLHCREPIKGSATECTSHAELRTISVCSRANQPTQLGPQQFFTSNFGKHENIPCSLIHVSE